MAGNGYIYPFIDPQWQEHLNTKTTMDMEILNRLIRSIDWWRLKPSGMDGMKKIIVEGEGTDSATNYVASAATDEGDLLVAYIPPSHNGKIIVDLSVIHGKAVAQWLDPSTGERKNIKQILPNGEFVTPGKNKSGYSDWVLVVKNKK